MSINQEFIRQLDTTFAQRFPIRLKKAQKEAFLNHIEQELQTRTYQTQRLTLKVLPTNRILITNCKNPRSSFWRISTPPPSPLLFVT